MKYKSYHNRLFGHGGQNNLTRKSLYHALESVKTDVLVSYLDKVSQD